MALSGSHAEEFRDAFDIARRVKTSSGGFRTFRRHFPDLDLEESREIWDRVWPRAQRVNYYENANAGQFTSTAKLGCSDIDTHIQVGYEATVIDADGNQHTVNVWATSALEERIGQTRNDNREVMLENLKGFQYFRDRELSFLEKNLISIRVVSVKCQTTERR